MKIFQMNAYEWWAADSLEEAIAGYKDEYGLDQKDIEEDSPTEITDKEYDALGYWYSVEDRENNLDPDLSFREQLKIMAQGGEKTPCLFASNQS